MMRKGNKEAVDSVRARLPWGRTQDAVCGSASWPACHAHFLSVQLHLDIIEGNCPIQLDSRTVRRACQVPGAPTLFHRWETAGRKEGGHNSPHVPTATVPVQRPCPG